MINHRLINFCLIKNSYCVILTTIVMSGFLPLSLSSAFNEKIGDPLVNGAKARGRRVICEKLKRHAALCRAKPFTFHTARIKRARRGNPRVRGRKKRSQLCSLTFWYHCGRFGDRNVKLLGCAPNAAFSCCVKSYSTRFPHRDAI